MLGAGRLQQGIDTHDAGAQEGGGLQDGAIDVRLGREVDDGIALAGQLTHQRLVGDVPLRRSDSAPPFAGSSAQTGQVGEVAGVGQLVHHDDLVGRGCQTPAHERGADEAGSAGDQDLMPTSVAVCGKGRATVRAGLRGEPIVREAMNDAIAPPGGRTQLNRRPGGQERPLCRDRTSRWEVGQERRHVHERHVPREEAQQQHQQSFGRIVGSPLQQGRLADPEDGLAAEAAGQQAAGQQGCTP